MGRILVYGWYGHQNVGDELMAEALRKILAGHELRFVDHIKRDSLADVDLVLIGGGSFLSFAPNIDGAASHELAKKPVVYAGVGAETEVHWEHAGLLRRASAVFVRSTPSPSFLEVRDDAVLTPDLSLALTGESLNSHARESKRLLVLPNAEVVPDASSPNWMRAAWDYFKSECAQALDVLLDEGWQVQMAPLCSDASKRDEWAAAELAAHCTQRHRIEVLPSSWFGDASFAKVREPFERASTVLTQRFHGAPIAQATVTPCVVVHHHDKLARVSPTVARLVPYYGARKDLILEAVHAAERPATHDGLSSFWQLRDAIEKALG